MSPKIHHLFWSDPDVERLSANSRYAFLWLITNPNTSILGICEVAPSRFAYETRLPEEALRETLEALPKALVIYGAAIWIRSFIRHQFGVGEKLRMNNMFVPLRSRYSELKNERLKAAIATEYPEFLKPLARACQGERKGKGEGIEYRREGAGGEEASRSDGVMKFAPPTVEQLLSHEAAKDIPRSVVEAYFNKKKGAGWRGVTDWEADFRGWILLHLENRKAATTRSKQSNGSSRIWAIEKQIEALNGEIAKEQRNVERLPGKMLDTVKPESKTKIQEYRRKIDELQKEMAGLKIEPSTKPSPMKASVPAADAASDDSISAPQVVTPTALETKNLSR